ncbi:MAG: response regulator [Limnobacter sp.]|nr:response regulator [Limnobacter sp.]
MTSVLVIDPDPEQRANLEKELQDSNQFGRVNSCASFSRATALINQMQVEVVLIDRALTKKTKAFKQFHSKNPTVGVVLVSDSGHLPDKAELESVGAHAQTSRMSTPIEKMACIAKALVNRFRPSVASSRLMKRLMKD